MHDAGSARRFTLSICPFATTLYNVHRRIHPNCVLLRDGANVSLAAGVGETLFGVIVDTECDATGQLLTPLSGLPSPSRCKPASFRAAFDGPAMLVAPVWPVIGTAHYDFSAHLADAGEYALSVRLDFDHDEGLCGCIDAGPNATRAKFHYLCGGPQAQRDAFGTPRLTVHVGREVTSAPGTEPVGLPMPRRTPWADGTGGRGGRWLAVDCGATAGAGSYVDAVCGYARRAPLTALPPKQQWYHRSVLDLLRGGRWLYVPHDQESYRVLPFEGLAPRGGSYWLHLEGDSTLLRGEKEELIWLMSAVAAAANTSRALGRPVREVLEQHAADIAAGRAPPSHHSIVNHLRVRCVAVGGNWTKARVLRAAQAHVFEKIGACGSPKAQGVSKNSNSLVNLFSFEIDAHGTEFHLSTGAAGGSQAGGGAGHSCYYGDADLEKCNGFYGVGGGFWRNLADVIGPLTRRSAPDALAFEMGLHIMDRHTNSSDLCTSTAYEEHVSFWMRSLVAALPATRLLWRGVTPTLFSDGYGYEGWRAGAVQMAAHYNASAPLRAGDGWPPPRASLNPAWSCRTPDRVRALDALARRSAALHGVEVLDIPAIAAAFENASIDNRHIDGGIERKNEQPVSLAMVNELLNELHNEAFWSNSA